MIQSMELEEIRNDGRDSSESICILDSIAFKVGECRLGKPMVSSLVYCCAVDDYLPYAATTEHISQVYHFKAHEYANANLTWIPRYRVSFIAFRAVSRHCFSSKDEKVLRSLELPGR
jgi:hypothetical protein